MPISNESLSGYHCHRWIEFPPLALYMDQVIISMDQALGELADELGEVKPTMINNYVKQKIIRPPEKKKYDSEQLASLIIINILKNVFTIGEISRLLEAIGNSFGIERGYNMFCEKLERSLVEVFEKGSATFEAKPNTVDRLLEAATSAFACWLYVKQLMDNAQRQPQPPVGKTHRPNRKQKDDDVPDTMI